MSWKTLSSRTVYKNSIIAVKEDKVIFPNGDSGVYAFTLVPRTVGVVPIDKNSSIYLCKQYRHILKDYSWEIPRGMVDKEETTIQAAERELLEESKLLSRDIKEIASLRLSIGFLDEECTIFLAQNVMPGVFKDKEQEIDQVKRFSFRKALSMIEENEIIDGLTVSAILMVKQKLNL